MLSAEALPNWTPPDNEPIGVARARQYVTWIRDHAGPLLAKADRMIRERYPHAETHRVAENNAWPVDRLRVGVRLRRHVRDGRYLDPAGWSPQASSDDAKPA